MAGAERGGGGEGVGRAIGGVQKLQVPVLGSQRCLICAFNKDGTWPMSGARLQLLTQDFTRSLTGEEVGGGGGGRPRHRLSAKIASIDSIIANLKNDKRVQAKSSVVGADSKRKGNARLIVAELDTKLGGSGGGGGSAAQLAECKSCRCQHCHREVEAVGCDFAKHGRPLNYRSRALR